MQGQRRALLYQVYLEGALLFELEKAVLPLDVAGLVLAAEDQALDSLHDLVVVEGLSFGRELAAPDFEKVKKIHFVQILLLQDLFQLLLALQSPCVIPDIMIRVGFKTAIFAAAQGCRVLSGGRRVQGKPVLDQIL